MTSSLSTSINKKPHSSFWNAVSNVSFATTGLALITTALGAASASAATFTIPTTTVLGTNVDSGPSFTVNGNFTGSDLISLEASGTVNLATDKLPLGYFTNPAGIATQPTFAGQNIGGAASGPGGFNFGALLLGNSSLGFFNVFPSNSSPSSSLALNNVTLASLGFTGGFADGTVLEFRINDITSGTNNAGSYSVGGSLASTQVPEPFTVVGTLIGGTAALRLRKKLKSAQK
jgi:hypothetical protein